MNLKTLRKELPKGAVARRDGKEVIVVMREGNRPVEFRVSRDAGWEEKDLAQYLASKIPMVGVMLPGE
jgi:hypothetical protein